MNVEKIVHTFSIVAYDSEFECWGVAAASKFLAVGALVPYAKAEVGAIATQSSVNSLYGEMGLDLLRKGFKAKEVLEIILNGDMDVTDRQVGIVDKWGNAANFTGDKCSSWAGGIIGKNYSVQGNLLFGEETVHAIAKTYEETIGKLEIRLYKALKAGEDAGGDKRGKQSACMVVVKKEGGYGGYSDRYLDLRVDNHSDPLEELRKLLDLHEIFLGYSDKNDKIFMNNKITKEIQCMLSNLGYYKGPNDGLWNKSTEIAFLAFCDNENLEQRIDISNRIIDKPALEYIKKNFY